MQRMHYFSLQPLEPVQYLSIFQKADSKYLKRYIKSLKDVIRKSVCVAVTVLSTLYDVLSALVSRMI